MRGSVVLLAAAALIGALCLALLVGPASLGPGQIFEALLGEGEATHRAIIWSARLPRICLAATVGAALSIGGAALQGLFRNPLADPYVLGISSGGALGAAVAVTLGLSAGPLGLGAPALLSIAGAGLAAFLVYRLALVDGALPAEGILLAGVAVGLTLSAALSLTLHLAQDRAGDIVLWLLGHLGGASWREVAIATGCCVVGGVYLLMRAPDLDLMLLGEETAASLGVDTERLKTGVLWATAVLVAGSVAFAGLIGFVGLIVPHTARLLVGPGHRRLMPLCAVLGAASLLLADTLARTLTVSELPVGVVTGCIGGPFFLYQLRQSFHRA